MNTLTLPLCPRIASRLPEAKGQYPPVGCSAMVQSAKLLKASNPLRVDRECPEELESSSVMGQWEQERFLVDGIWGGPKSPHWRGTGSMPFEPLKYPFCSVCCRMFATEKRWWRGFATRCPPALYSAMWKRVRLRAGTAAAARSSTILLRALPSRQQGKWNRPGRHPQPSAPRGACACRVIPLNLACARLRGKPYRCVDRHCCCRGADSDMRVSHADDIDQPRRRQYRAAASEQRQQQPDDGAAQCR